MLLFILTAFLNPLKAQLSDPGVSTIPISSPQIQLVPLEKEGFILLDFLPLDLNAQQFGLQIDCYDTLSTGIWKNILPVTKGSQLQRYQQSVDRFFIAFTSLKDQHLDLFNIDLATGHFQVSSYRFSNAFEMEDLQNYGYRVWVSGKMSNHGVVFELDLNSNSYNILPSAFSAKVSAVTGLKHEPSTNTLSYLLKTTVGKQESFVYRSLNTNNNRVLLDIPLQPPPSLQLTQAYNLKYNQHQIVIGTYFKKNPEQTNGVYLYKIGQSGKLAENYVNFKELPGFADYVYWPGPEEAPKSMSKKELAHVIVDEIMVEGDQLLISLELMEKRYQVKGALQQEFERSQLVTMLDQNQYGRRNFDQATEGQTVEDRINKQSATDILQYRYRNAIVNQPIYQGYGYERTLLMTFNSELDNTSCKGIKSGTGERIYLGIPNTFSLANGIRQVYDQGGRFYTWIYHPDSHSFDSFKSPTYLGGEGRVFHIAGNFIAARIIKDNDQFFLKVQKLLF